MNRSQLLRIDGLLNLLFGAVLLLGPLGSLRWLGFPEARSYFYSSVLGGVLAGVGVALLLSVRRLSGLGLAGAVAINVGGALAVAGWLVAVPDQGSPVGRALLWIVALGVLSVAVVEVLTLRRREPEKAG